MSRNQIQEERENYSITVISFLASDTEFVKVSVYVNGEFDDSLQVNSSTTIFLHSQDKLTFEAKFQEIKVGSFEIEMHTLIKDPNKPIEKWFCCQGRQDSINIQLRFDIQEMGKGASSKLLRDQTGQANNDWNEQAIINSNHSGSQKKSSYSNISKSINHIQNASNQKEINPNRQQENLSQEDSNSIIKKELRQQINYLIEERQFLKDQSNERENASFQESFQQKETKEPFPQSSLQVLQANIKPFTISPIKEGIHINNGYVFQKIHSPTKQVSLSSIQSPKHKYSEIESEIADMSRKIYNKSFNQIIDKKRGKYLELKQILQQIQEYYQQLHAHPCKGCEKKYLPLITNGLSALHQQFVVFKAQVENNTSISSPQSKQSFSKSPIRLLDTSTSKNQRLFLGTSSNQIANKKEINITPKKSHQQSSSKKTQENENRIANLSAYKNEDSLNMSYRSPKNKMREEQLREEIEKADNLEKNANFVKDQLESQFKRTRELENENKSLKFKNFVMESDLKNLGKRLINQEKTTFATRGTFKMQEFREIFEYFHALRLEQQTLKGDIDQLQKELKLDIPIPSKNQFYKNSPSKKTSEDESYKNEISNANQRGRYKKEQIGNNQEGETNEIQELLTQRKNVINELLERLEEL